jgi:hypothetical protein
MAHGHQTKFIAALTQRLQNRQETLPWNRKPCIQATINQTRHQGGTGIHAINSNLQNAEQRNVD